MTDYNKLAQRIVAAGVGEYAKNPTGPYPVCRINKNKEFLSTQDFCNDSRVMLALMEKAQERGGYDAWQPHPDDFDKPLAVAICEACCEALETDEARKV